MIQHLQLRSSLFSSLEGEIPFAVYTVGADEQKPMNRWEGFSANQLLLSFSGTGLFRLTGEDKWDTVPPRTLLYIPGGLPHEYRPQDAEPWLVGYVTFMERESGPLSHWGFGSTFSRMQLQEITRLDELLYAIWSHSGPDYDPWQSAELLFSFCLEVKKQAAAAGNPPSTSLPKPMRYRNAVVHTATRFLQDHLQRNLGMAELSAHVGYSSKQLTRLFQETLGTTPLQYLQKLRLQTAVQLLEQNPNMTVQQAAMHVGMEAVYFTRLFRRLFGVTPSQYREHKSLPAQLQNKTTLKKE
ncbi:AraC family transcriptional regulator [Paenibacillus sp. OAS669]|uniref:AraC family transcriptional regulator n=1 Tax=Paenibacillus sp. OAS669 TaxID=2663821 RepID=UPI001A0D1E2D|nr:AraC family transcriptional regulator [Paenibacillus sp. OAS669]MBE1442458.1 AraC-like DNA-binding protein [Paenibacillus sp. OAS669]